MSFVICLKYLVTTKIKNREEFKKNLYETLLYITIDKILSWEGELK